jgi:hypothetical protein
MPGIRLLTATLLIGMIAASPRDSSVAAGTTCGGDVALPAGRNLAAEAVIIRFRETETAAIPCAPATPSLRQAVEVRASILAGSGGGPIQERTDGNTAMIRAPGGLATARQTGTVVAVIRDDQGHLDVVVDNRGSVSTYIGGLASVDVDVGETVSPGTMIGRAGLSGEGGEPVYRLGMRLPGEVFETSQQGSFVPVGPAQMRIDVDGWNGDRIEVWIDGIYVAEMNRETGFTLELRGVRPGTHSLFLIGSGFAGNPKALIRTSTDGGARDFGWSGSPFHLLTWRVAENG